MELTSELLDLTGIDLFRLAELPESVLTRALGRVYTENADQNEPFASFESHI